MSKQKILVIEDERPLSEIVSYNLEKEGFEVITAADGMEGLRRAQNSLPDLILLDLMLPVMDGIQVCRELRSDSRTRDIRIIMMTAKSEEVDEIVGFSMGADDYVTKPFKIKPLLSRIRAVLRRPEIETKNQDVVSTSRIQVDRLNHSATIDGSEVQLTPTEFKLLWTLARHPGRPFRRNELMDICRGEDANALERTIDVHIRSLRQKMGDGSGMVETVRGVGYRLKLD
jgi:two-component system phosphate regulon response regulator PhoB